MSRDQSSACPRRRNPPLYDVGVTGSAMPDLVFPIYMGRFATSHETATGRHNWLLLCRLRQSLFSQSAFHVRLQRNDTTEVVVPTGMTKTPVEDQQWRRNKTSSCDWHIPEPWRQHGKPSAPGTLARKRMQSRKPSQRYGINGSGWCRGVVMSYVWCARNLVIVVSYVWCFRNPCMVSPEPGTPVM